MGSILIFPLANISIVLLAFLSILCEADLISNICSKAQNPYLCNKTLKSDNRSRTANLRGLGQIIIEKAEAATQDTINVAKSAGKGTGVGECVGLCVDAINKLKQCSALLKDFGRGSVGELKSRGSGAMFHVGLCDDVFGKGEPVKVKKAARRAQDFIDMLLAVASSL
ncbi:hypothetical protein ABFS83_03G039000 [Erythranthe nasuta]